MTGDGTVDAVFADHAADLKARWLPTPESLAHAKALLDATPEADMAVIPMLQPGKTRSWWTTGQEVRTVPGVIFLAVNGDAGTEHLPSYPTARAWCAELAGMRLAELWQVRRDADPDGGPVRPGTTAHAVVTCHDGEPVASVFEDW